MSVWLIELIVALSICGYLAIGLVTARSYLSYEYQETKKLINDDYWLSGIIGLFWPVACIYAVAMAFGTFVLKPAMTPGVVRAAQRKARAEQQRQAELERAAELGLSYPVARWEPESDWYH